VRIYSEDQNGQPQYDWTMLNAALDRSVYRYGMVPVLSMSFMPDALAEDVASTVSWSGCPKTPPNNLENWGVFMDAFA
jgi:hypothetical protein